MVNFHVHAFYPAAVKKPPANRRGVELGVFSRIQPQSSIQRGPADHKIATPPDRVWFISTTTFRRVIAWFPQKRSSKQAGCHPCRTHTTSSHQPTTGSDFRVHTGRTKYGSARDLASTESPDPFRPYSSNLPRLRLDGATRLNRPSAVPTLFSGVSLNRTPALSPNVSWPLASPARRVFSAPRFQSKSLTNTSDHRASVRDWLLFPTMHPLRAQLQA